MSWFSTAYPLVPVNVLEVLFCFLGLFGSVLLWPRARLRSICLPLMLMSILMAFNFAEETGLFVRHTLVTPALSFATGPAFYLFVRPLVYTGRPLCRRDALHLLPTLIALPFTSVSQLVLALGSVSLVIYGVMSFRLILHYSTATKAMRADADSLSLKWLLGFMLVFAVLALEDIARVNSQPYVTLAVRSSWYFCHQLAAFAAFVALVLLAARQPDLFDDLAYFETHVAEPRAQRDEPARESGLKKEIFAQLDVRIREEELYRQPRLSLLDLGRLTGLNSREISQSINHAAGKNFSEYINGLRVDAVVAELSTRPGQTRNLLQLATEAGFNSKSSFNSRFKAHTGQTPTQYVDELRKGRDSIA